MIGIVATFKIDASKSEAFEALLVEFVNTVKAKEPGAVVYNLWKDREDSATYHMMEQYADQAALDEHGKTEHMQALMPKIGAFLAGPPSLTFMDAVN